jgi:hypothetical protein
MKKFVNIFLTVVFIFSFATSVSADEKTVSSGIVNSARYLYTISISNNLVITGNTASCQTVVSGLSTVTKIEATQYLQKWNGSAWVNVSNAQWSDSVNGKRLSMTNEKSGLSSGTYRVYAEAFVYIDNNYEKVTGNSNSVTI